MLLAVALAGVLLLVVAYLMTNPAKVGPFATDVSTDPSCDVPWAPRFASGRWHFRHLEATDPCTDIRNPGRTGTMAGS
jgi:hypothetical protein